MPTPDHSTRPAFTHPKPAIQNFVDTILDNPETANRAQYIMLCGILLNNTELIASKVKKLPIFKRGEMLANIVALKKNIIIR